MTSSKVLVSACLIGKPCRFDGKHKAREAMMDLHAQGKTLAVCPEEMGGLSTPRSPAEKVGDRVLTADGRDVTAEYQKGAEEALRLAQQAGITQAFLKSKSPMCGCQKVFDGSFSGNLVDGDGILANLLLKNGIQVQSVD